MGRKMLRPNYDNLANIPSGLAESTFFEQYRL